MIALVIGDSRWGEVALPPAVVLRNSPAVAAERIPMLISHADHTEYSQWNFRSLLAPSGMMLLEAPG